eukprot:CAMPEP_0113496770 /NCGR_PEP_ID=MMETSP0014_2-20120614/30290_1 /TAXON_ID=2857 /ORGANISM="Nitzschia sp." /LENGTH=476 /DNA_ID=CAMNT_0000390697 /DNA_START=82 /DNA_END=1508 /DNA_ORIENTATION=- /assembly_acc=CAM_ASM_000159
MARSRRSSVAEAHEIYKKYHRHYDLSNGDGGEGGENDTDIFTAAEKKNHADSAAAVLGGRDHRPLGDRFPMYHRVTKTGVIYATSRAAVRGFRADKEGSWANMGQGAPETGPLPGSPPRDFHMTIPDCELEYAPVTGLPELRQKVADYYNHLYRTGMDSQYTKDNVCIVPGGRAGITRIMAILGTVQVGYFCPDYTAYEQALGLFIRVSPSPLIHRDRKKALMPVHDFEFEVRGRGLGAVLVSNPANPTGQSIEGEMLDEYVSVARKTGTSIIMDEFYSHYYYDGDSIPPEDGGADDNSNWPKTVSSAKYIEDVNKDPILIVNGLTKNWRCPGFRVCWIVAPKEIVSMLGSAGSYLDGGANAPLQRLALPLMELDFIRKDTWALQKHFKSKRDFLLEKLEALGIKVQWQPTATFYVWADISALPSPLNDSLVFLEECVKREVICVPGVFFDLNPRGLKQIDKSPCIDHVRFSYGPP